MKYIRREKQIIEDKIEKLKDVSFKLKTSKDIEEKEKLDSELKNIVLDLKKEAIAKFQTESDVKKFLDNIGKFNKYSSNNQFLIWTQNPNAEYVTSFQNYKKMGYHINKGAKGIKILIPNFLTFVKVINSDGSAEIRPYYTLSENEIKRYKDKNDNSIEFHTQKLSGFSMGNVFDINDTTMPKEALQELNPVVNDKRADEVMDSFIKAIYRDGFKVEFKELNNSAKGYCDHKNKLIVVKKGLGSLMGLKVLIHEYSHGLAHKQLENDDIEYEKHRSKYEIEAESIAYTVSKYLGVPTMDYSIDYLYNWSKEKDFQEIDESLTTIINYSNRIIKNFNNFYDKELVKSKTMKI